MLAAYVSVKPQTSLNWRFLNAETLCLLRFKFPFLSHHDTLLTLRGTKNTWSGSENHPEHRWRWFDFLKKNRRFQSPQKELEMSFKISRGVTHYHRPTEVYQTQCSASQSPETPNRRLQNCSNEGTQLHRLSRILNVQFGDFLLNVLATNSSRTIIHQLAPTEWNTAQQPGPETLSEARQQQTALR